MTEYTAQDLYTAAAGAPDITRGEGRYLTTYWLLPAGEPDALNMLPAAKLTCTYRKGIAYIADLELARIEIRGEGARTDRGFRETFDIGRRQQRLNIRVSQVAAGRFNQKAFASFQVTAQDLINTQGAQLATAILGDVSGAQA